MTKAELDYILGTMLDSYKNVSDLNVTADKPLQVESSGELVPVAIEPPVDKLTPFQTEIMSLEIMNRSRRLTDDLIRNGSCPSAKKIDVQPARDGQRFHQLCFRTARCTAPGSKSRARG